MGYPGQDTGPLERITIVGEVGARMKGQGKKEQEDTSTHP
jgi:hypothetical protein